MRFIFDLLAVIWHELRFRYYAVAYRHIGDAHPDSQLVFRRLFDAQTRAADALRRLV